MFSWTWSQHCMIYLTITMRIMILIIIHIIANLRSRFKLKFGVPVDMLKSHLSVLKWEIAITKLTKSCEYNIEKSQFHTFSKIQMRQILSTAQANRICSESKHPKNNGWCVEWFRLMFDDASNDLALCSRLKFGHSAPWHRDDIARLDDIWKP